MSNQGRSQIWLSRFAWLCVAATLALIFLGGMVTSKQAGLAVPDWPLSYDSINPPGWWHIENVRLEHGHRLIGALIGMLTIALTVWVWRVEDRRWLRWLAVLALAGVIVQGIMGGLRVTERSTALAVVHGCVAQAFLCVLVVIAAAAAPGMSSPLRQVSRPGLALIRAWSMAMAVVVYVQLILGATMRHYGAGLAIPDFPLAFGQIVPPLHTFPVIIHFSHRVGALFVTMVAALLLLSLFRHAKEESRLFWPGMLCGFLVMVQIGLGASVIWLAKPPVPTTFHVLNGAMILAIAVLLATRAFLYRKEAADNAAVEHDSGAYAVPEGAR